MDHFDEMMQLQNRIMKALETAGIEPNAMTFGALTLLGGMGLKASGAGDTLKPLFEFLATGTRVKNFEESEIEKIYGDEDQLRERLGVEVACPNCGGIKDLPAGNFALIRLDAAPGARDPGIHPGELMFCQKCQSLLKERNKEFYIEDWTQAPSWVPGAMALVQRAIAKGKL